jgi:hypothetical protein
MRLSADMERKGLCSMTDPLCDVDVLPGRSPDCAELGQTIRDSEKPVKNNFLFRQQLCRQ